MLRLHAKGNMVLFKQLVVHTSSGIILPDGSKDKNLCRNIVVSIGDKVTRCDVGDEVIIGVKQCMKIHFPDRIDEMEIKEALLMAEEDNVIATVEVIEDKISL